MSLPKAPVYVRAHDLAVWLVQRADGWPDEYAREVRARIVSDAMGLASETALALSFPTRRDAHRDAADERALRLRVALRIACDAGRISPRQRRYAIGELDAIGRMLGGWQRSARRSRGRCADPRPRPTTTEPGAKPRAAPTA